LTYFPKYFTGLPKQTAYLLLTDCLPPCDLLYPVALEPQAYYLGLAGGESLHQSVQQQSLLQLLIGRPLRSGYAAVEGRTVYAAGIHTDGVPGTGLSA
jgi:hypothetical protein